MSVKLGSSLHSALSIFKAMGKSEPRFHPDRRDWESMTFYRNRSQKQ